MINIVYVSRPIINWCFVLYTSVRKLAKDCCKYGNENENQGSTYPLARASLQFGNSYEILENERETLLGILGDQVIFWDISLILFSF